jgi:hypothetical protein
VNDQQSSGGGIVATWRRGRGADEASALREQLDRLTAENMRLRLEQQRPLSLGAVSAQLAATADALANGSGAGETPVATPAGTATGAGEGAGRDAAAALDEAQHQLARASTLRATVLDVVQSLQVAAAQLERQLVADVPLTEVDRRVRPRRRADGGAAGLHSVPEPGAERRSGSEPSARPAAALADTPPAPRVGGARA